MKFGRRKFLRGAAAVTAVSPIACDSGAGDSTGNAAPPSGAAGAGGAAAGPVGGANDGGSGSDVDADVAADGGDIPPPPSAGGLPQRILGRTKVPVSMLGFGMGPLQSNATSLQVADRIVSLAIDLGVNYLDVAPSYGNAESKLKSVLARRRKEVFLVTKCGPWDAQLTRAGVLARIQQSLQRLGTDVIDLVHIHQFGDAQYDVKLAFTEDGALGGLKEARKRGYIRFIGISAHERPSRHVSALATGEFDVTMMPLNFVDRNNYDFEANSIPAAMKQGTACVAMKVLGGAVNWIYDGKTTGNLGMYIERALRYALGLPGVATAVLGMSTEAEVRQATTIIRNYKPLPADERLLLLMEGKLLAPGRVRYFGEPGA